MNGFVGKLHLDLCALDVDEAHELLIMYLDNNRDNHTVNDANKLHEFIERNKTMNNWTNENLRSK